MLKQKQSDSTETCSACIKNTSLIKKYEQLIHLYKKKQVRLSTDGPSRIKATSHSIQMPNIQIDCIKLQDTIRQICRRKLKEGFMKIANKRKDKLAVLSIVHKLTKLVKKAAFGKIQKTHCHGEEVLELNKLYYGNPESVVLEELTNMKQDSGMAVVSELVMEMYNQPQLIRKACSQNLEELRKSAMSDTNRSVKQIKRLNFELHIQNKKLSHENTILKQCIEELNKRQMKQNAKKRQSLEMLAEEINEKNEQIIGLKQTLRKYQLAQEAQENVLEEDVVTMRNDIQHLQRIRDKLNNDLDKVKLQMEKVIKSLKEAQASNQKLVAESTQMKRKCHQSQLTLVKTQKTESELTVLIGKLQKKMKRLSLYENQLLGGISQKQLPTCIANQQLKSELILLFLANISDSEYKLQYGHLFDDQQKLFLSKHKDDWKKLIEQEKMLIKIESASPQNGLDLSGIEGKAGHMDSIFQALDSPRETGLDSRNAQGPTMRLLELELQKKKQIEKISELKDKFLHIRIIILNLLKSLEIQPNLKTQTLDIIRLVFDLFQFSEEERDSIFTKKKRLFSFL